MAYLRSYRFIAEVTFKPTKIIGQRKAFYRQRIPESSCVRKETVDIDILNGNKNHAIYQDNE